MKGINHIYYGFGTNSVAKVHDFAEETKELRSESNLLKIPQMDASVAKFY